MPRVWDDRALEEITPSRRTVIAWTAVALAGCAGAAGEGEEASGQSEEGWSALRCRATTRDAVGPYYEPGAPARAVLATATEPGTRLLLTGKVLGPDCLAPMVGYVVDVWQADDAGTYYMNGAADDYRLRGKVTTNAQGQFQFQTIIPGRYTNDLGEFRPAHLHVRIRNATTHRAVLTTQLYFKDDPYLGSADFCTVQGTCNSSDAARIMTLTAGSVAGVPGQLATITIVLPPHQP